MRYYRFGGVRIIVIIIIIIRTVCINLYWQDAWKLFIWIINNGIAFWIIYIK